VRGFDPVNQLLNDRKRVIEVQWAAQVMAFHILHHQIVRPNIVQMADIWMIQRSDCLGFALKALRKLRGGNFDRNIAIQAWIARPIYLTHATCADKRKDLVGPQASSGRQRHVVEQFYFTKWCESPMADCAWETR
jgi:hypothetical protein